MTRPYFSGLVLFLVVTCSAFASDKPKINFDEFFNSVAFTAVQISPDGDSVVIATERADWDREIYKTDLWLYRDDSHGGSLTQLTQSGHDSVPRWSPDGRWIAFLSERSFPGDKGSDGDDDAKDAGDKAGAQIYLISPNGGEAFPITSGDEEVHTFSWSSDSKTIYFATRTPWNKDQKDAYKKLWKDTIQYRGAERGDMIFGVDLKDALQRHAAVGTKQTPDAEKDENTTPGAHVIANTPWRVQRLEISPGGGRLAFVTTSVSQREEKLEEFEIYSVDLTHPSATEPRRLTHNQALEQDLTWAKDSRHIYFLVDYGSAEGPYQDNQRRLYWIDADSGEVLRWAGEFEGAVISYAELPDGRALATGRLGTEVQLYTQVNPKSVFAKQPGWAGTYEMASAAKSSQRLAFAYSSLDRPTEVYLADAPDKLDQARPITAFNKLFTERDLPRGKTYRWKSEDGTTIEGILIYPPDKFEAKNLPLLTLIHGGPNDADGNHFEADWYQWDRLAASNGWLVFEPNYRGSTGYGDKFILGIIHEIVSRPGKDILAGVDALVKEGIADPDHLTLGGYSYGGYMTNWLITQTTRFRAAVTSAGAVEHVANWGNDDTVLDDAYFLGGRAWEAPKRYYDEAAIYQMDKVRTPTHIVTGADDARVAPLEAYLLDRALHSLGIPTALLVFPGEDHSLEKNPWHGKIKVREELRWLQKYAGVGTAP